MPSRSAFFLPLVLLLSACVSTADPSAVQPVAVSQAEALAPVNAFRASQNLPPLTSDPRLAEAAARQSAAMAARDEMGHGVAGKLPGRVKAVGYDWATTAENLGRGYPSYPSAMEGWIGSAGHRRNLLNPAVTQMGAAAARDARSGRLYWTQIFGAERDMQPVSGMGRPVRFR